MMYTAKLDYFATGEGRTLMILVGNYSKQSEAYDAFSKHFDPYFAQGCDIVEGVDLMGFEKLVPEFVQKELTEGKAYYEYFTCFHYNLS